MNISVRHDLIGAWKTQSTTIWSLRKYMNSAKGKIRVNENRTLGLRRCISIDWRRFIFQLQSIPFVSKLDISLWIVNKWHHRKFDIIFRYEMTKITISYQSHKSKRKYKSENGRTRTSKYIRGGIRCHGGVSIPCWLVTPTVSPISTFDRRYHP
jgi:hypothetical protein